MRVGYGQPPFQCWPPPACLSVWRPRPQDLSYLFFALVMLLLTLARRRHAWLFAVPPCCSSGPTYTGASCSAWVLALEVVWVFCLSSMGRVQVSHRSPESSRAYFRLGLLATLVNPHGPALLAYALKVTSSPQLSNTIAEWQSPNFHSYLSWA